MLIKNIAILASLVSLLMASSACLAVEEDSVDRDYAADLPRIQPTPPADALETFRIATGFRIEQVAAEPLVVDPVAMAFDADGRLFVIEMRGYSEDDKDHLGRVRVLEDVDSDGKFDRSTIFAEGFSWPTAITCSRGGVFVGAAPDIFFLQDTDGDNRADLRQKVFSGFGRSNVQGLLNTFKWGIDNRIHGATSSSGGKIVTEQENLPAEALAGLDLRGRDFAFDPATLSIQATSGGAQHGLSFNRWGEKFVCSNSDHIQMVIYEDRYVGRNPFLVAPRARLSIAADGPQADVFRASPIEPWRTIRTRLRVKGIVPGPVEGGGTAAGYFTGSTGVTIFRGTAWPKKYQGWAVVGDVGSNLVHRKSLESRGLQYVAKRFDEQSEFLSSSDIWFRPVQFANGPDGALYIADMYREVIEHPLSLPPIIKRHLDLTSGRDRGRIYRIVGSDFQQPKLVKLSRASSRQLVDMLDHANGWQRETAARLLTERKDRSTRVALETLVSAGSPVGRIRALYALYQMDWLNAEIIIDSIRAEQPRVTEHALRLAEYFVAQSPTLRDFLLRLAERPQAVEKLDLRVRFQLAFTLGELPSSKVRNRALTNLALADLDNPWIRVAVRSSLFRGSAGVITELVSTKQQSDQIREWIKILAGQIGAQQRSEDVAQLLRLLQQPIGKEMTTQIIEGLAAKPDSALARSIASATGGTSKKILQEIFHQAQVQALDSEEEVDVRVAAVGSLTLASWSEISETVSSLVEASQPITVQVATLDVMSHFEEVGVAQLLINNWRLLSPRIRSRAGDVVFSRSQWIPLVFEALETGHIAPAEIDLRWLRIVALSTDENIASRAKTLLASSLNSQRQEVLTHYQASLDLAGEIARGEEVFKKNCSACHQIANVGNPIGPNLAAMRNRGAESVLVNLLDPNREVNPAYLSYVLVTDDGRTLTGMIIDESATTVTLRTAKNAVHQVLRINIEALYSTGTSLMPEGLEKQIDLQSMADLIAFLTSLR